MSSERNLRIEEKRVSSLSVSPTLPIDEAAFETHYLVPEFHIHFMPDQAVVSPPGNKLFWDTPGTAEYYAKQICHGSRANPFAKFPVKIASRQMQFVNKTGRDIYSFIDGTRTTEEVYRAVLDKNNEQYGAKREDVFNFLKNVVRYRHATLSATPLQKPYTLSGSEEYAVPVHASLEVTANCNARCKHCYGSFEGARAGMLDLQTVLDLLARLRQQGVRTLELTGGECSTHPDFPTILEESAKMFDLVAILTNGIAMPERVFEIATRYAHKLMVQICINGRKEFHDDFVGVPGSFERSSRNITRFAQVGVFSRVSMNLTFENSDDIEYVLDHAQECGATTFAASMVVMSQGRAATLPMVTNGTPCKFLKRQNDLLVELEKRYPGFVICHLSENATAMIDYNHSCGVGRRTIYITSDGLFHLCPMSIGSGVPGYSTVETFMNAQTPWDTPFIRGIYKLKAPDADICRECRHVLECLGCITRGIQNYLKAPENCPWGEANRLSHLLTAAVD